MEESTTSKSISAVQPPTTKVLPKVQSGTIKPETREADDSPATTEDEREMAEFIRYMLQRRRLRKLLEEDS